MAKSPSSETSSRRGVVTERTPVKGGWVKRDSQTGKFMEVTSEGGSSYRSSPKSVAAASAASEKRRAALKRLADR